ncbi:MAG: efflux transporter outer membrane subunit, partial [Gluconacetobacter diazotrophicus]|nr:efflux transporter outer membrane subunit [Gluconacetobacter diazotrophicus]
QSQPQLFSAYSAGLNLGYTIDVWGGLRRAVEQTAAQAEVQRFQLEAAYLALGAGVANAVVLAASLAGQIAAQEQLIGFEQQQLRTVQQQFELGGATGTDVATQQAQVAQAQTVLVPLQTQLVQARDQIAAYTGRAPSELVIPVLTLDDLRLPTELPLSLPAALLAQRPDIRAAAAALHVQTAALGVAIAARLPNFTLQAGVGSTAADTHQLFSPTNGMWSVVNQVVQPIFDAGQLLHRQRAQRAAMDAAAAQWRQTVVTAFQNTADVLAALQNDALTLRYALAGQVAAQKALSLASLQYKLGGVSYLSVLTAQQTFQNTVITLVRARAQRLADTVALFQALGGGWWNRRDLPPPPPGLLSSPLP